MRLTRLEIHSLPGVEPGFSVNDFAAGINLITGPNGIGKSSLIRALQALVVEPSPHDPAGISLAASFAGPDHWSVKRTGQQQVWELAGRPAQSPRLPRRDVLRCYWLTMEDLLVADERDDRLSAELRRSLAGGYDLLALRNQEPFRVGKQNGMREARALREAQAEQRRVEAEYAELQRQEAQLPELDERIDAARRAAQRSEQLRQALALLAAQRQRRQVEAVLEGFARGLERLRGDEMERLAKLDDRRRSHEQELRRQGERLKQAADQLTKAGFGNTPRPQAVQLDVARDELEEARRAQEQLDQERRQMERARASEERTRAELAGSLTLPQELSRQACMLSPQALHEAETLARRLQQVQSQHADQQGKLDDLPAANFAPSHVELYWQAAHALRVWLAVGGFDARLHHAVLALALAGSAAAGVGAYRVDDWIALGGAVLAGLGLAAAGWLTPGEDRRAAERRFAEAGLQAPRRWRADAVRERLQELETARADLQRRQADTERAAELRKALDRVGGELQELELQRLELGERLGFDPQLSACGLDRLVRLAEQFDRARDEGAATRENCRRFEHDRHEALKRVRQQLSASGVYLADGAGLAELESALSELRERSRMAEHAERDYYQARREQERLRRELDELTAEREQLFTQAGLEPDERAELARRCEQHPAWREQRDRLREAGAVEAERRSAVAADEQLLARVDNASEDALQAELEQSRRAAEELDDLRDQASTIRTRLHDAGRDWRLEQAMAETEAQQSALYERYEAGLGAEAAQVLLDRVEREHRQYHEPQVLSEARERFRRFSRHNYDLRLGEDFTFFARDLTQQVDRELAELSTGTRMQLLLAVRLAWADQLEQDRESLPLFLDEALTTSDEGRFELIAQTLGQMASEEGRQVFYLSARRHELALWQRALGTQPHVIDLAQVRFGVGREDGSQADFALPEHDPLPVPGEQESAQEYALRIAVPTVEPRRPAGAVHIFHLLRDDLALLHRLLEEWRITTLGQLEGLLESSAAPAVIADEVERVCLQRRSAVARLWVSAWRYGRGNPVDRAALERSGAVSSTFIDRVAELSESLNGDGQALIEALRNGEVRRFQASKTDELAQWLEDEGFIDPATPFKVEERERQVLYDAAITASADEIKRVVAWLEGGLPNRERSVY